MNDTVREWLELVESWHRGDHKFDISTRGILMHTVAHAKDLLDENENLRKYATHEFGCPVLNKWPQDCTCGLEGIEMGDVK